jgi:hypothetical protein
MKPKRYPYIGNKKQPHEEIAKLESKLTMYATGISILASRINVIERNSDYGKD